MFRSLIHSIHQWYWLMFSSMAVIFFLLPPLFPLYLHSCAILFTNSAPTTTSPENTYTYQYTSHILFIGYTRLMIFHSRLMANMVCLWLKFFFFFFFFSFSHLISLCTVFFRSRPNCRCVCGATQWSRLLSELNKVRMIFLPFLYISNVCNQQNKMGELRG